MAALPYWWFVGNEGTRGYNIGLYTDNGKEHGNDLAAKIQQTQDRCL